MRFSLAHELGHLVKHSDCLPGEERELEANLFAAEFLMPSYYIYDQLIGLRYESLMGLKARWGCSMLAIVMRAKQLELLSDEKHKGFFIRLSPYRKKELAALCSGREKGCLWFYKPLLFLRPCRLCIA